MGDMDKQRRAPPRVGFLIYPGVQALDVAGPMDAFHAVRTGEDGCRGYEPLAFALDDRPVVSESGLTLAAAYTPGTVPSLDTLIIPGGRGARDPETGGRIGRWVAANLPRIRRVAAVCTGAFALAETGALDGRRVTTHWQYSHELARRFPDIRIQPDAIFLKDGPFYTSAGITAGIDLALALIEEDYGSRAALAVARELVVYVRRPGGQVQFSDPLRLQVRAPDRLADVATHIAMHLRGDLSVDALAARAHLSPRQFTRRFKDAFGVAPAAFVEAARLEEARRLMEDAALNIDQVASAVGFASPHVFRRAFARAFGVAPKAYRARFTTAR
jgi:transcriptional regulator GlxA family with amidase domain